MPESRRIRLPISQNANMMLTPRPGTNRKNLRDSLNSTYSELPNLQGGPQSAYSRLLSYLNWTSNAVRVLGNQISDADLNRLVLTKRYELLLAGIGNMAGTSTEAQRVVNGLVGIEQRQRIADFEQVIQTLDQRINSWSGPMDFIMPDTSFYIKHPDKLEKADFAAASNAAWLDHPIHVLVPIVVVDELDRLKESKDRHIRWRAGYTLAVIDRVCEDTKKMALLRNSEVSSEGGETILRGPITIELIFDPPGHVRLPIDDDEMIDRALAVEPLTARKITMITYDTGQSTRARAAGLAVRKLSRPLGDEPERQT